MTYVIIATITLVCVAFVAMLAYELHSVGKLKESYDKALAELQEHPTDSTVEASCREAGLSYYHMIRIQEHAMFSDFPVPYYDAPELEQEFVNRDIREKLANRPHAA